MIFRTLLVDDEDLALQRMQRLLSPHAAAVEIVGTAKNGTEAVQQIETLRPDLVFLDIQMPELDGFSVLKHLQHKPWIIFCTAYDEYALSAFETQAIDYLLKPVSPERLQKALAKLLELQGEETRPTQDLHALIEHLHRPQSVRLQVRTGDRIRLISAKEFCFFRAADKYVEGHTREQHFLLDQSLNQLAEQLAGADFVRIHRSALVNLDYVEEITRRDGGQYIVRMRDSAATQLPISRSAKSALGL